MIAASPLHKNFFFFKASSRELLFSAVAWLVFAPEEFAIVRAKGFRDGYLAIVSSNAGEFQGYEGPFSSLAEAAAAAVGLE